MQTISAYKKAQVLYDYNNLLIQNHIYTFKYFFTIVQNKSVSIRCKYIVSIKTLSLAINNKPADSTFLFRSSVSKK